jgi:integrase
VQKLLDAAVEHRPEMIAPLALGFFAGIRTAEIRRLDWDRHIRLAKGQIQITGDIAKKRSVRNVDITPNLMQWLALAPVQSGPVAPQTEYGWRNALETVREKAEVARWPHNVMRHSFGSYHLEQFGDPTRTALQMGHRGGDDLLFDHYRQLTTAEDAEKFFAIAPKKEHQVIAFHQWRDPAVNNGA